MVGEEGGREYSQQVSTDFQGNTEKDHCAGIRAQAAVSAYVVFSKSLNLF